MAENGHESGTGKSRHRHSWPMRLLWFVGLWVASVTLLGMVAYGIRLWLGLS